MYASIHRCQISTTSVNDAAEVGWRLGAILARSPGFVAAIVVEDSTGVVFAISLFDDQTSLIAATPLVDRWTADHCGIVEPDTTELVTGEVVAQKGL